LDEEGQVVDADVALGDEAALGQDAVAADVVVAVDAAARLPRRVHAREQRLAPVEGDEVAGLAALDVVADAGVADAGLQGVLAGAVEVGRAVELELQARLLVEGGLAVGGDVRVAGLLLEVRRHPGHPYVAGREAEARALIDALLVVVVEEVAAAEAE